MASQFSRDMARKVGSIMDGAAQAAAYDAELAEVREVLVSLQTCTSLRDEPHWCDVDSDLCSEECRRVRSLYNRLRTN